MSIGDEGQFRFTNGTAIDSGLNKDRILDVINHEFTHNLLYSTTSYGQFVMMLLSPACVPCMKTKRFLLHYFCHLLFHFCLAS